MAWAVCMTRPRSSEVMGPGASAICSKTWSTPDSLLSLLMQRILLHEKRPGQTAPPCARSTALGGPIALAGRRAAHGHAVDFTGVAHAVGAE
ncbi:hypothetical protein G6F68_016904 [Rhizopus microsporus]|nr:hypothetical protein G6F68_016904 [Rhizopus microsporus]